MSFINKCGQISVLGLFQPGCPFPYIFHRAVRVVIHPPAAERELQDEENYSCQAAGCDTKLIVQRNNELRQKEQECRQDAQKYAKKFGRVH